MRHEFYEDVPTRVAKEQRKLTVDHPEQVGAEYVQPLERGMVAGERIRCMRDNGTHLTERGQPVIERGIPSASSGGGRMMPSRERSPLFDDRESTGSGQMAPKSSGPQSYNGGIMKEVEKGALGLPQDKMALVREKKDEIEKVDSQTNFQHWYSCLFLSLNGKVRTSYKISRT